MARAPPSFRARSGPTLTTLSAGRQHRPRRRGRRAVGAAARRCASRALDEPRALPFRAPSTFAPCRSQRTTAARSRISCSIACIHGTAAAAAAAASVNRPRAIRLVVGRPPSARRRRLGRRRLGRRRLGRRLRQPRRGRVNAECVERQRGRREADETAAVGRAAAPAAELSIGRHNGRHAPGQCARASSAVCVGPAKARRGPTPSGRRPQPPSRGQRRAQPGRAAPHRPALTRRSSSSWPSTNPVLPRTFSRVDKEQPGGPGGNSVNRSRAFVRAAQPEADGRREDVQGDRDRRPACARRRALSHFRYEDV